LPHRVFPAAIAALAIALAFPAAGASIASHPFTTGLAPSAEIYAGDQAVVFDRMHAAGMSSIDAAVDWVSIAPAKEPDSWRPADPNDPHYDWSSSDVRLRAIAKAGFQPIVVVAAAPTWARVLPQFARSAPKVEDFAAFMRAAAERYSGRHSGLPRVRYWRIWSEPNISVYFELVVVAWLFLRQPSPRPVLAALGAAIIAVGAAGLIGVFYYVPRPFVSEHFIPLVQHAPDASFPSDHLAALGALVGSTWLPDRRLAIATLAVAAAVAFARGLCRSPLADRCARRVRSWSGLRRNPLAPIGLL